VRGFSEGKSEASKQATNLGLGKIYDFFICSHSTFYLNIPFLIIKNYLPLFRFNKI
jgi:hypothetical protein